MWPSSLPMAAWHGKPLRSQACGDTRSRHVLDIAADGSDGPNAAVLQRGFKCLRDSGTDQRLAPEFPRQSNAGVCISIAENALLPANLTAVGQFDQQPAKPRTVANPSILSIMTLKMKPVTAIRQENCEIVRSRS
jgi:hypothetical protein